MVNTVHIAVGETEGTFGLLLSRSHPDSAGVRLARNSCPTPMELELKLSAVIDLIDLFCSGFVKHSPCYPIFGLTIHSRSQLYHSTNSYDILATYIGLRQRLVATLLLKHQRPNRFPSYELLTGPLEFWCQSFCPFAARYELVIA